MAFDPTHQFHWQVADGMAVVLRSFTPEDREALTEAFKRLSPESLYFRFWTRFRDLNPRLIEELCAPDQVDHVGWVVVPETPGDIPGLGGGSFWRLADDPSTAEVSFTVGDEFQGLGVATMVLAVLWEHAVQVGIQRFVGRVLNSNLAMRAWWGALGAYEVEITRGWEITLPLDESQLHDSSAATKFRHWLKKVREGMAGGQ
jgi:RimJ/RimL family protein N-acetyltransferase